jgi:hypothetical protein
MPLTMTSVGAWVFNAARILHRASLGALQEMAVARH